MSPTPGRSTLITSAPSHASSCVQVGPDCTWVKSRMRTPSSALPAWPHGLALGRGTGAPVLPLPFLPAARLLFAAPFLATDFLVAAFLAAGFLAAALTALRFAA